VVKSQVPRGHHRHREDLDVGDSDNYRHGGEQLNCADAHHRGAATFDGTRNCSPKREDPDLGKHVAVSAPDGYR